MSCWRRISFVCIVSQFILIYFYFFVTRKKPDEAEIILIGVFKRKKILLKEKKYGRKDSEIGNDR